MFKSIKTKIKKILDDKAEAMANQRIEDTFLLPLRRATFTVNSVEELKLHFHWKNDPILDRADIYDYAFIEDSNQRRVRDAEALGVVMANVLPKRALEFGTSDGSGTLLLHSNSPTSEIHTINLPPEGWSDASAGRLKTYSPDLDTIGARFRERGLTNIRQILANSATWVPDIEEIQLAFIDGCHDTEFVIGDTKKALSIMSAGGFVLWHDFNLDRMFQHPWIREVCLGVQTLLKEGHIKEPILHLKDSWIGIARKA